MDGIQVDVSTSASAHSSGELNDPSMGDMVTPDPFIPMVSIKYSAPMTVLFPVTVSSSNAATWIEAVPVTMVESPPITEQLTVIGPFISGV